MELTHKVGAEVTDKAAQRSQWARLRREREDRERRHRSLLQPRWLRRQFLESVGLTLRPRFMRLFFNTAYRPNLTEYELRFAYLPPAFDNYRILHLTDCHFDRLPGIEHVVAGMIQALRVDLAVFTGDYQDRRSRSRSHFESAVFGPMQVLCEAIQARDGILATLGNHDSVRMVAPFESMDIRVLCNETTEIRRGDESIRITGLDDVHRYYTPLARQALRQGGEGFKIALVHSADLYEEAADNGYALQLSGHTHGGQICLPGGIPITTNLKAGRRFASGLWQHRELTGITSRGVGTVGIPVRLFCPGEVLLITLRRST